MGFTALLKLIPLKAWAIIIGVVALLAFLIWDHYHLINEGVEKEKAAYAAGSAKAEHEAEVKITNLNTQHGNDVADMENRYETTIQADDAAHASDAARLREYDAYRKAHPVLGGPAAGGGTGTAGEGSADSVDDRFGQLEQVALGLANAGRDLNAALTLCQDDRNKLTGK
jgi:hypothetical protein